MTALAEVLEKLERATFGVLRADAHKDWFQPTVMLHSGDSVIARYHHGYPDFTCTVGKSEYEWRNAEAIEACVNFVREHGPALLRDAGDGAKDSARLDWLCSGDLKMVEESPARCFRVYRDIAPPENPHAQWHAFTEAVFPSAREAIDAAMHAPGGAANDQRPDNDGPRLSTMDGQVPGQRILEPRGSGVIRHPSG